MGLLCGNLAALLEQGLDLAEDAAAAEGSAAAARAAREETTVSVAGAPAGSSSHSRRRRYLRLNDALEAPESAPMQWPWLVAAGGTPPAGSAAAAQRDWLLSFAALQWLPLLLEDLAQHDPTASNLHAELPSNAQQQLESWQPVLVALLDGGHLQQLVGYFATHTEQWAGLSGSSSSDSTGDGTRCGGADNTDADGVGGDGLEGCVLDALEAFCAHRPQALPHLMLSRARKLGQVQAVTAKSGDVGSSSWPGNTDSSCSSGSRNPSDGSSAPAQQVRQQVDAALATAAAAVAPAAATSSAGAASGSGGGGSASVAAAAVAPAALCANPGCSSLDGPSALVPSGGGKTCSRCRVARYCCGLCQLQHWRKGGHATQCPGVVAATAAAGSAAGRQQLGPQQQQQQQQQQQPGPELQQPPPGPRQQQGAEGQPHVPPKAIPPEEAWKLAGVFGLRTQEAVMTVLRGVQQGPGQGEG
eukprot:XP_001697590.1 predicted protein [Chlamydomonas reinhardtii]